MAGFRMLYRNAFRIEWAVCALPRPQVRLALQPFLPGHVLRLADDPGFAQGLDLLRRILPLEFSRRPEVGWQCPHVREDQIPIRHVGARLFKSRALFAVLPRTLAGLQGSCPGKIAVDAVSLKR